MSENVRGADWLGLGWQRWIELDKAVAGQRGIPRVQGIYRVRRRRARGLLYMGSSVNLSKRLRGLHRGLDDPDGGHHYAAGCVASRAPDHAVRVCWVELPDIDRRELMGREVDLIAAYRTSTGGKSPSCQFAGERLMP